VGSRSPREPTGPRQRSATGCRPAPAPERRRPPHQRGRLAPAEIDPPEFVRGLETAKRVSAALLRELDLPERIEKQEAI